jgi:hypothetical protein
MMMPSPSRGVEIADEAQQPVHVPGDAAALAVTRWRAAEGRLYPLIMVDSGLYEAAVTLVCEAADVLRWQCRSVDELLDVDAPGVLARCPSAPVMTALGFDPGTALAAACAYRWRELTADHPDAEHHVSLDGRR